MAENRCSCSSGTASSFTRDSVVIDTMRVLDSCRDRDCYEDVRVYLTPDGRELVNRTATVRTVDARIVGTAISVSEVPFNCGFYRIDIRFYIRLRNEACLGAGTAREFYSLAIAEKSVVLYGGEGETSVFRSANGGGFCCTECVEEGSTGSPLAVVEAVSPIILSTRVLCCDTATGGGCCSCDCKSNCACDVAATIPESILELFEGGLILSGEDGGNRLLSSIGIFSVVRLERPAQLVVNATDYAVPDKECPAVAGDENPCCLFKTMAFPTGAFGNACGYADGKKTR